jgi:predicted DNA-binding protein (UPF0251 family)
VVSQPEAAKLMNVSVASVKRATVIRKKTPKLAKAVKEGKIKVVAGYVSRV